MSVLILCSSGILALCATLQSEINKVMNEWMNEFWDADIQIYETQEASSPSPLHSPIPLPPGTQWELAHRLILS